MAFQNVLLNVGLLIALGVPGYLLKKFNKLNDAAIKGLVVLLIFVAQPAMVAKGILSNKFTPQSGLNILIAVIVFAIVMLTVFALSCLFFHLRKMPTLENQDDIENPEHQKLAQSIEVSRVMRFTSMFGNTGYFGLPLIAVLFPNNTTMLLYTSMCVVMFNVLTWTLGVWILTGDKRYISLKKGLLNPVPITVLITLPIYFINSLVVPTQLLKYIDNLGTITTPLSMIIMGARLAEIPFKELFNEPKVYISSFLRLLVAPAIAFVILLPLGLRDNTDLFNTLIVICMMPSAVSAIVFCERFITSSLSAVKAVLLSSLLCIVTVPLICSLILT